MGRLLTQRYALAFEKKRVKNPFSFLSDVYKHGKVREIISFAVWELLHKLRLFRQRQYLTFNNRDVLELEDGALSGPDFSKNIVEFFRSKTLGLVPATHNWKILFSTNNSEVLGSLYSDDRELYRSVDGGQSIIFIKRFPTKIKSIFVSSQNTIFVCTKGSVYKSSDNGGSFKKSLDLGSSESFFRHNNAMTETPVKTLIIGEYGNIWDKQGWRKLAFLYFSKDEGETWETSDFLIQKGINKHVHLVKYSHLFNKILMADGDNKKKLWVSDALTPADLRNPDNWKPVNRFHIQLGGYTSIVECDDRVVFGTDYQGGTNFIVETANGEKFTKRIVPDPYRRSPIDNMVQRKSKRGNEIWANLPYSTANTKCLLMYSTDGGQSWTKVIEYSRTNHKVWLLNSSNGVASELYFSIDNLRNKDRAVYKVVDPA